MPSTYIVVPRHERTQPLTRHGNPTIHDFAVLTEIVIICGAALLVIFASHRLRVPSVVGFLLTGVFIGPYGLGLISDSEHIEVFAELAVVLILFRIGLEVSVRELRELGRLFLGGGSLQAGVTASAATLAARALGADWPLAVFCGFVVTLSSTAIALKLLGDRRELHSPHGRLSLGVLLFQDILIVPMLLVVPLLAGTGGSSAGEVLFALGEGLAIVAGVFLLGRFLVPRLLGLLARTGVREMLLLAAVFACLGSALITHHLGLSMALGGFLAGVVLAESEVRYLVRSEIGPFRDVFNALFFTSIGMLLSLSFVVSNPGAIAATTVGIVALKAAVIFAVARLLGFPLRTALAAGLTLCQIGEFSFVLLQAGRTEGLVPDGLYSLLIAASVLTMLVTPLLSAAAAPLAARFGRRRSGADDAAAAERLSGHVVICGWGLNGQHLSSVLREGGIPYVAVDADPSQIRAAREAGEKRVLFGDAGRPEILSAAGLEDAAALVLTLSDPTASRQAIQAARSMAPEVPIIVRARVARDIPELVRLGADEVVGQDLETSIEITRRVLAALRLPPQLIRTATRLLHHDNYQALRSSGPRSGLSSTLLDILAVGTAEVYPLRPGHWACGKDLRDLDLRRATRVTILAVMRDDQVLSHPDPGLELREGDSLVLAGAHTDVAEALDHLETAVMPPQEPVE